MDPVPALLAEPGEALRYFVRRDLRGERVGPPSLLWELPEARRIFRTQRPDGSWPRQDGGRHGAVNYPLIETWRRFRVLVEQFGFTREHAGARKAAEYLFSCQTREGDIRGMLADQYAPYYTGAILALLIRAGYQDDARVDRGLRWLLSMRQDDGGWTIPILTRKLDRAAWLRVTSRHADPIEPDRSKPFSHHWTGMVLRAFAAHPKYRDSREARAAAELVVSRFFRRDSYRSYGAASTWVRFEYPFWWNNLVTALDSLSQMRFSADDPGIGTALEWLRDRQVSGGLWKVSYAAANAGPSSKARSMQPWVTLAICRVFRRLLGPRVSQP